MFSTVLLVYSLLVFLASGALCIWLGYRRGVFNSAMRLGFFLLSGIVAFVISRLLVNPIGNALTDLFTPLFGKEAAALMKIASVQQLLVNLVGGLVAPIVFMLLFFVLNKLAFFAYLPLKKRFADNEKLHTVPHDKLFGGILGFVLAFCTTLACIMPVGYVTLVAQTVNDITATSFGDELPREFTESVSELADASVVKVDYALSGWLLRGLSAEARSTAADITSLLDAADTLQKAENVKSITKALKSLPPESVELLLDVTKQSLEELLPNELLPYTDILSGMLDDVPNELKKLSTAKYNKEMETLASLTMVLNNPDAVEDADLLKATLSSTIVRELMVENSRALSDLFADTTADLTKKEKQEFKTVINNCAVELDIPYADVQAILSIFGIQ